MMAVSVTCDGSECDMDVMVVSVTCDGSEHVMVAVLRCCGL